MGAGFWKRQGYPIFEDKGVLDLKIWGAFFVEKMGQDETSPCPTKSGTERNVPLSQEVHNGKSI